MNRTEYLTHFWQGCETLRADLEPLYFRDCFLTLLFIRLLSQPQSPLILPPDCRFDTVLALRGESRPGQRLDQLLARLTQACPSAEGVLEAISFSSYRLGKGREASARLSALIDCVAAQPELPPDLSPGTLFMELLQRFALAQPKNRPAQLPLPEIRRLMTALLALPAETEGAVLYDPCCGSASLLLESAAGHPGLQLLGHEQDRALAALGWMNLVLHGLSGEQISLVDDLDASRALQQADFVLACPLEGPEREWREWLSHLLEHMPTRAVLLMPQTLLYGRGQDALLRQQLIARQLLRAMVVLPVSASGDPERPACVLVLEKSPDPLLLVDARQGAATEAGRARLRSQDVRKIRDACLSRQPEPHYTCLLGLEVLAASDYHLHPALYFQSPDQQAFEDLAGHVAGGIPARALASLSQGWPRFAELCAALFEEVRPGYLGRRDPDTELESQFLAHPEYQALLERTLGYFDEWRFAHSSQLEGLGPETSPEQLILDLSEDLLACFEQVELLSRYDLYQILMDYWENVMLADIHQICRNGWAAGRRLQLIESRRQRRTGDLELGEIRYRPLILPRQLLMETFFRAEREQLARQELQARGLSQQLERLAASQKQAQGVLAALFNEKGQLSKTTLKHWLRDNPSLSPDERQIGQDYLRLLEEESLVRRQLREGREKCDQAVFARYARLSDQEIRLLVVQHKWFAELEAQIRQRLTLSVRALLDQLSALESCYAEPLGQLKQRVALLSARSEAHLMRMGLS
jgi:type I restriction enzyme M protein